MLQSVGPSMLHTHTHIYTSTEMPPSNVHCGAA